jgi:ABC-2 type transport system ATP-binding protein
MLRVHGVTSAALNQKLSQIPAVKRLTVLREDATSVTARVFPKNDVNGALAANIADATQGWHIEELHTEEGRLDEVFRSITMPDTVTQSAK